MAFLWILFIVASIVFIVLYYILFKATVRQPNEMSKEFSTVYAGTADKKHLGASPVNINLTTSTFLDDNGNPINVDEYDGFVVSGDSMELANIKDGNLLLVRKNELFTDSTPLPGVFVLKRENALEHQGKYKLRRIWAVSYLDDITSVENIVRGIMKHPEFKQLSKKKELFLDEDSMLKEFLGDKGRLAVYQKEHPHWNEVGAADNKVVISTTLRTESEGDEVHTAKGRHISFSVHPTNLVVGKVAFVYSVKRKND